MLSPVDLMQALDLTCMDKQKTARKVLPSDETRALVLNLLGGEPLHVDEIRRQASLPIKKISATLACHDGIKGHGEAGRRDELGGCPGRTV